MITLTRKSGFYGWRVVGGAFVLAVFGLGIGFHGPGIYLQTVHETRGWPVVLVSAAVTAHFLAGAIVVANLPALYARFGIPAVTKGGALLLAAGIVGWACAVAPWQLFAATLLSGAGWVTMGVAAVNAIVSPWFVRARPAALAMAYNGANAGGVIFSPLWVAAIALLGFPGAAAVIGAVTVATVWLLADRLFSRTPQQMGLGPDGDEAGLPASAAATGVPSLPGASLWRDRRFLTLAAGMALGLFAQIGTTAHLFSLLTPTLGAGQAGVAIALVTTMAILGRTVMGWVLPAGADRRLVACASYAVQIVGSLLFAAAGASGPLLFCAVVLFGLGFGNGTYLPPLVAQAEFARADVSRVVSLIVAISQAAYAFAPAAFGLLRELARGAGPAAAEAPVFFVVAAIVQALAIGAFLAGRRRRP